MYPKTGLAYIVAAFGRPDIHADAAFLLRVNVPCAKCLRATPHGITAMTATAATSGSQVL